MMKDLTKKQNRHLRELAGKAYAIELSNCMEDLYDQFAKWKSGELTVWELSDLIHEFHDGDSRDLYKFYVYGKNYRYQVAHGIHSGFLSMDEVEESCREYVQSSLDSLVDED